MLRAPTIYYCSYENCNASYNHKYRYEIHLRSHTGERPYICTYDDCEKAFTCSTHLLRHESIHEASFRCTEENCLAILKTKATLNKHIRTVHLKLKKHKVYTCTQCGAEFNKHITLQRHELKHSGQLPHKCTVEDCQKAFLTPSKLKRHMKIHEGYPCKVSNCNEVFGKWSLYVRHMRDFHRPEYKCKVCAKVFTRSHALKLHIPIHEERDLVYPCEVPNCSRYYYAEKNLRYHMRKYHAKRPFMCEKENCHRAFKTEAELAEHILYHGKKKPRKKNKPKKSKPSLAAIVSGYTKVKEEKAEIDILSSCNVNLIDLKSDTVEILSSNFLEENQSSTKESSNLCVLKNEDCSKVSKELSDQNLFESSQLNALSFNHNNDDSSMEFKEEMCESILSMSPSKSNAVPMECKTNNSSINLEITDSAIQQYTTIEVVDSENNTQLISVPIISTDENWNKTVGIHIESVS